ncbi:MAG: PepSY domain-containing protein [Acetobacteraceae bacterium]|nr:PepSY domain-containing protein [Acetobacteraceae bacterium]
MIRRLHSLPGLFAAVLIATLALTGAFLAFDSVQERAGATVPPSGQVSVAAIAAAVQARYPEVERLVRTASGSVIAYYFEADRPGAVLVDPLTGGPIAPHEPSNLARTITNLHRSFLAGDAGRAAAGLGALAMLALCVSGAVLLAGHLGGWKALLRPSRGTMAQRLHCELGRAAFAGLTLSALTGVYMSLATFGIVPDGDSDRPAPALESSAGVRVPVAELAALRAVDLNDLRELAFPAITDPGDTYALTTAQGAGEIDAATGQLLGFTPHGLARRFYETIYLLHTGQGAWPLALLLGASALAAPVLAGAGALLWWRRRGAQPRIAGNVAPQTADTIILVGSEGNSTWSFAATLHAALTAAGHRVHAAPMNALAAEYGGAERVLILAATYGDGDAPASAKLFARRLAASKMRLPVAVLGFGDRGFPRFCQFAEEVSAMLSARGWPMLIAPVLIDRQSVQDFAQWGQALGAAIGTKLDLVHVAARPKTVRLVLADRVDYGAETQAPTAILRFVPPPVDPLSGVWRRWRTPRLPRFVAGDLVGILAPGAEMPRFYSLASATMDGVLEICVRKQPGGVCSGFLHALQPGDAIAAFIRPNPRFRPAAGKAPLILIGAGAGIAPLAGFIRHNRARRPVHLYWGGRHPASDFLYEAELNGFMADKRLAHLATAFSRAPGGSHVQGRLALDAAELRSLIQRGAQVMVCGGRDMAAGVARTIDSLIRPLGFDLRTLRMEGRYLEDVY